MQHNDGTRPTRNSAALIIGESFLAELALIYYPHTAYDSLVPGATFTIREGPKVVGFGVVKRALLPDAT